MTDQVLRQLIVTLSALAVIVVLVEAPSGLRVPVVVSFAMLAPGLAVTRFVPAVHGVDRLALAGAISLALNIVMSLLLVSLGEWSGEPVLAVLVAITLGFAFLPRSS